MRRRGTGHGWGEFGHFWPVLATAALAWGLWGCGYRHTSLFPSDVRTVAVPIFENQAYYRGVELGLTEALKKQIEWRTPYKVVVQQRCDTVLSGQIDRITQGTLSRRRDGGLPQDMEYRIVVSFEWKDLRSGKILRQRVGMEVVAPYVPAHPVGETLAVGQYRAVQRVAERIVSVMIDDM